MSSMFYGCKSLLSIDLSNFDTSSVTSMNNMFSECNSLEYIDLSHCETPLLTNLERMFYNCRNLKVINLTNFTTSLVTSMKEMFYGCISLIYLDISNFDMINCISYSKMFSNINSLRFINLLNFKNDKAIASAFKKAKGLFVCQKEKIIINPKVYYCCDYNFDTNECETISEYNDSIDIRDISDIDDNSDSSDNNDSKDNGDSSDSSDNSNSSDSSVVQKTEEINIQEENSVLLIGINQIKILEQLITFFIYFELNSLFADSEVLKFPLEINSRRVLRLLETVEAVCQLVDDERKDNLYAYFCKVEITSNQNIKSVKFVNKFEFSSVNFAIIASFSLLIEPFLDNLLEIGNKLDFLSNSTLYNLENSKINLGENQVFNISGIINDPKPKFEKVDLNLYVFTEYDNKKDRKEIECSIIDIIENNYTLSCIGMKNTNFSLKNAISIIEDEILIINLDKNENSTILFISNENENQKENEDEKENESENNYPIRSINNKSGNIGAGRIIGIIIACLAALAVVIISIICIKKRNKQNDSVKQESTIVNLHI